MTSFKFLLLTTDRIYYRDHLQYVRSQNLARSRETVDMLEGSSSHQDPSYKNQYENKIHNFSNTHIGLICKVIFLSVYVIEHSLIPGDTV